VPFPPAERVLWNTRPETGRPLAMVAAQKTRNREGRTMGAVLSESRYQECPSDGGQARRRCYERRRRGEQQKKETGQKVFRSQKGGSSLLEGSGRCPRRGREKRAKKMALVIKVKRSSRETVEKRKGEMWFRVSVYENLSHNGRQQR